MAASTRKMQDWFTFQIGDFGLTPRNFQILVSEPDTLINEITGDLFSCAPADALVHWYDILFAILFSALFLVLTHFLAYHKI